MKWLKRTLIALAALLASAAALPFFISLDDYLPRIEQEASAQLKQPVSIKHISLRALPWPRLTVEGIGIGNSADLSIVKVVLVPDLYSLLQPTKVIKRVDVDSLALTRKAIERFAAWPDAAQPPRQAPPLRIERVHFNNALIDYGKLRFGPFDARVVLDTSGAPQQATVSTQDGKLKALIEPQRSGYRIELRAQSWTLPAGPALLFDELVVKGVATSAGAKLGEVRARLYGGSAAGSTAIDWRKWLRLEGRLDLRQIELKQLTRLLSPGARVSGKLSAAPVFSASARSADRLMDALRLTTRFDVQDGTLYGVDIEQAVTDPVRRGSAGGETRFEQLSGRLVMRRGGFHITQLKIASGALAAEGKLNISAQKKLSGRINAQVKALGGSAGVPLNVAGTLASPLLYPTAGTLAGAAAGTALLGPVVGTSVGAKVGGWVEGLFGEKDAEKAEQ